MLTETLFSSLDLLHLHFEIPYLLVLGGHHLRDMGIGSHRLVHHNVWIPGSGSLHHSFVPRGCADGRVGTRRDEGLHPHLIELSVIGVGIPEQVSVWSGARSQSEFHVNSLIRELARRVKGGEVACPTEGKEQLLIPLGNGEHGLVLNAEDKGDQGVQNDVLQGNHAVALAYALLIWGSHRHVSLVSHVAPGVVGVNKDSSFLDIDVIGDGTVA